MPPHTCLAALPCCPPAQEWASFGDYVTEVINSVDAERISEVEAEKRLVPAVVYQVRPLCTLVQLGLTWCTWCRVR